MTRHDPTFSDSGGKPSSVQDARRKLVDRVNECQRIAPASTKEKPISLYGPPFCNRAIEDGEIPSVPTLHVLSDRIILFHEKVETRPKSHKVLAREKNLTRGRFNGYLSKATTSKVRKMLDAWTSSIRYYRDNVKTKYERDVPYLVFVTLTLSATQKHDDNWIKRNMLGRMIQELKRKFKVRYYFWRAEAQKNGNIHFHLLVDRYIPMDELQLQWNLIQDDCGYLDGYFQEHGDLNAPSTHVKKLPEGSKLTSYLLKYIAKKPRTITAIDLVDGERVKKKVMIEEIEREDSTKDFVKIRIIKGRIWGCSDELRGVKGGVFVLNSEWFDFLERLGQREDCRVIEHDHGCLWFGPIDELIQEMGYTLLRLINECKRSTYLQLYTGVIKRESVCEGINNLLQEARIRGSGFHKELERDKQLILDYGKESFEKVVTSYN